MFKQMAEEMHFVVGLAPAADVFSGTVTSDVVNMKNWGHCAFYVSRADSTAGTATATLTVEACDNANGDNPVAIPYRVTKYEAADDVPGTVLAEIAAAGFTTAAGDNKNYLVEVEAEDFKKVAAAAEKSWVRLKSVEVVNDPVVGAVDIILSKPRFSQPFTTVIA